MVKANCNASPAAGHVATHALSGKIRKNQGPEYAEMQLYLSKLKELVPHVPKNKKVSKLEVIQHVIDYICDLQWALESHPAMRGVPSAVQLMQAADSEVLDVRRPSFGASDSSAFPVPAAIVPGAGVCLPSQADTLAANSSASHPISHSRTPLGVLLPTQNSTAVPSQALSRPESKA